MVPSSMPDDGEREVGMNRSKGVTIGLCLAVVIGGGWICLAARSSDQNAAPTMVEPRGPLSADSGFAGASDLTLGGRELFARMMLSVVVVIALGVGAVYLSKRVLPKVTSTAGKEIHIRETVYLGPRKALHLIEVGTHKLLIGSTSDRITPLAHLTDTWLDLPKQETDDTVRL
jgi:flagellar biogenesis protein FliO